MPNQSRTDYTEEELRSKSITALIRIVQSYGQVYIYDTGHFTLPEEDKPFDPRKLKRLVLARYQVQLHRFKQPENPNSRYYSDLNGEGLVSKGFDQTLNTALVDVILQAQANAWTPINWTKLAKEGKLY